MPDESFIEKMLHKMVKKHIAGTTMSAALAKAEDLNRRKIPASITFLTGNVGNKSRTRYVTITYMELIRRISRLGLKASVHVPSGQVGLGIDQDCALKNIKDIIATGNKYGVFVWLEVEGPESLPLERLDGARGYGFAFPEHNVKKFARLSARLGSAKILFDDEKEAMHAKSALLLKDLGGIFKGSNNVVLSSPPEKLAGSLANGSKYRGKVALEFKLGYSGKKLGRLTKKGARISVMVPFGKDWISFAMNRVPEGYMRFLANSLLNEKGRAGVREP
jgi:hypothetical protein